MTGMPETRRITEGDEIPVAVLRDLLFGVLRHDALHDALIERMDFHARREQLDPEGLSAALPEMVGDVLAVATRDDWLAVAEAFVEGFRDATGEEAGP